MKSGSYRPSLPVAQVEPRYLRWRRVRGPLFAGIALVVLVTVVLVVRAFLTARGITRDLERASDLWATDTIESHTEALEILAGLAEDHSGESRIQAALAWEHLLVAWRLGPDEEHLGQARQALERAGDGDLPLVGATRAGIMLSEGNAARAAEAAAATLQTATTCRECAYVQARALLELGRGDEAIALLDQSRQGVPPFLPALADLARLLREHGRLAEAGNAVAALVAVSSGHQGAAIEGVLLELDAASDQPEKIAPRAAVLAKQLEAVPNDGAHPQIEAYRRYAAGRLKLAQGQIPGAVGDLEAATKQFPASQSVARWLAVAMRDARRHRDALALMARFRDEPSTDLGLLGIKVVLQLDLARTADAERPLAILTKAGVAGTALHQGRRALLAGEPLAAVGPLQAAVNDGSPQAVLLLAESLVLAGKADDARGALRPLSQQEGSYGKCARGLIALLDGNPEVARNRFQDAGDGGDGCGQHLAATLLVDAGGAEAGAPALRKLLAVREDARDRVVLARLLFRSSGIEEARAELEAVRAFEPQGALVLRELVEAHDEMGLVAEAREIAKQAIDRTSGHPLALSVAARLARKAGDLDEASRLVSQGLAARAKNPYLLLEQAENMVAGEQLPEAEETINAALVPGPLFADAACLRSHIQELRGDRRGAYVDLGRTASRAKARSGAHEAADAYGCLTEIHLRRGQPSLGKARGAWFAVRQLRPDIAHAYYLAGQISERDNRADEAERNYRNALEADAAHLGAWRRLYKLGRIEPEDILRFQKMWPGRALESL